MVTARRLVSFATLSEGASLMVLLLVLGGSLTLNVWLGWTVKAQLRPAPIGGIKIGSLVKDLPARVVGGADTTLKLAANRPSVLYYVSPTCGWCERNYESVLAVAGSSAGENFAWYGIVRSDDEPRLAEHLKKRPLPFPVYLVDNERLLELELRATPTTLVVNP